MSFPRLDESQITKQVKDFMLAHGWRSVRMQRTVVPGQFQSGEPGMPDMLFIRYLENAVSLTLWVEFKTPQDRRKCRCAQILGTKKRCTVCDQAKWRDRERRAGGAVWLVDDLGRFIDAYDRQYGWLHSGDSGRGQLDLLAGAQA